MTEALVLYASKHGHTAKVAAKIAEAMQSAGAAAEVHDLAAEEAATLTPAGHDLVVLGASIHAGHYQGEAVEWARRHADALNSMPSAFFTVCLTAADDTEEARKATQGYIESFERDSGWRAQRTAVFAGALQYREYDFATRLAMRLMARIGHHPTDASRDYDFTDRDAVERFGAECAAQAAAAPA